MTNFPALSPTSRRITQGQYPVKRFTSIAGTGSTRVYGSQPFNASLELDFSNVPDADAAKIASCYEASKGSFGALTLPDAVWSGTDTNLRDLLERDYTWRFADQPSITSVVPGRSSVSVRLDGHRDG